MIWIFPILLLWTVSFFFAGIEAGLLSLDQVRLRHQVKLRNRLSHLEEVKTSEAGSVRDKTDARKETDKVTKTLHECEEWERQTVLPPQKLRQLIEEFDRLFRVVGSPHVRFEAGDLIGIELSQARGHRLPQINARPDAGANQECGAHEQ